MHNLYLFKNPYQLRSYKEAQPLQVATISVMSFSRSFSSLLSVSSSEISSTPAPTGPSRPSPPRSIRCTTSTPDLNLKCQWIAKASRTVPLLAAKRRTRPSAEHLTWQGCPTRDWPCRTAPTWWNQEAIWSCSRVRSTRSRQVISPDAGVIGRLTQLREGPGPWACYYCVQLTLADRH